MNNKPLVSIIIPTYNRKNMLKEAVDSVLKQDYSNIELIVSDNASEDGTHILIEKYLSKYKNIKYIKREKNIGLILNVKEAYKEATGKYVIFLCDDDYLVSNTFFSNSVKVMEENKNISLVRGVVKIHNEDTNTFSISEHNSREYIKGIDYFFNYHNEWYDHITSTLVLMKKDILDKSDIFNTKYNDNLYETWIYLYLFLYGDIYFLTDEIIACYRIHNNSRDTFNLDTLKDFDQMIRLSKKLIKECSERYPEYDINTIQNTVERHVFDILRFKLNCMQTHMSYKEAYNMFKKSELAKEFPNLVKKLKPHAKFYFSIFSIYIDKDYIKITILGIQIAIKRK